MFFTKLAALKKGEFL